MGQLQKVSWRSAGYAALGSALAAASVIAVVNSDGVRPTSLVSNAATRWLVDRPNGNAVLVDGLAGHVVAKISTESEGGDEVAVQGPGGAFLVGKSQGSVRTISTAKLQIGTPKTVGLLLEQRVKFGVGSSGLTVVSADPDNSEASVVAVDDVTRRVEVPKADDALVAADGSMWLLSNSTAVATHVNIDETSTSAPLRSIPNQTATVGPHAVSFDASNRMVHWLDGGDVALDSLPNPSEARIQESGDDAPCVWFGSGDMLACVGRSGIDRTVLVNGLDITTDDRLAIAGAAAVVVKGDNQVLRIDLEQGAIAGSDAATVPGGLAPLAITASGDLIWLDDLDGQDAWIVHRFGINHVSKNDRAAVQLDAQGQVQQEGEVAGDPGTGGGNAPGGDDQKPLDGDGLQDPPIAVDDSVTARAGTTITIPVLFNDYDPDGDAIAVYQGDTVKPTHGTTDVLDGTSVTYRPDLGYSGTDSFQYTIVDEKGAKATAKVSVELFPPDSPNRPPIARPDVAKTRVDKPVTIDVLSNDIDPERDMLTVPTILNTGPGSVTDTFGPTKLPALLYTPPHAPGIYTFSYQAVDPQGGTSQKTPVTVEVSGEGARNDHPIAAPDAIRLSVGATAPLDVKANDTDPDGDDLTILDVSQRPGVTAKIVCQQLSITLQPGAGEFSVVE
ncbi:MAG: large repetitive protein, partial [Ilumatobacteraceae bacterium]